MTTQQKYSAECQEEFSRYRAKCKSTVRGDGVHDLWVKLAWMNRKLAREWSIKVA